MIPAPNMPFKPLGNAQHKTLTPSLIMGGNQIVGVRSTAGYFDGPLGQLILFKGGDPFRLYLKGRVEQQADDADIPNDGDVLFDLAAEGRTLIRSQRTSGDFVPGKSHTDLLAYHRVDESGTWEPAEISAVDWEAGTVMVSRPAGSRDVALYFLTGDGELEIRITRPLGSDDASAKLFNSALRSLHEVDQSNVRSAPTFGVIGREYPLPPQFRLEFAIRSKTQILFDEFAQHEISLPMYDTPIEIFNVSELNAQAELKLRGGTL